MRVGDGRTGGSAADVGARVDRCRAGSRAGRFSGQTALQNAEANAGKIMWSEPRNFVGSDFVIPKAGTGVGGGTLAWLGVKPRFLIATISAHTPPLAWVRIGQSATTICGRTMQRRSSGSLAWRASIAAHSPCAGTLHAADASAPDELAWPDLGAHGRWCKLGRIDPFAAPHRHQLGGAGRPARVASRAAGAGPALPPDRSEGDRRQHLSLQKPSGSGHASLARRTFIA